MDDPASDKGEDEGVGKVFNYLTELPHKKHDHRSCPMDNIHYPIDIVTTQDQGEVQNGSYVKKPHEITCLNSAVPHENKPKPPYYWDAKGVTCRDWKIRYCCENMWGTPALYQLVSETAKNKGEHVEKRQSDLDVFVDKPRKRTIFEDCRWGDFIR